MNKKLTKNDIKFFGKPLLNFILIKRKFTLKWSKKIYDEKWHDFQAGGELKIKDNEAKQSLLDWLSKCTNI